MASLFENDSSDDDFSDNLQLAERLRINRENKIGTSQKKNFLDEQPSSSSSLERRNEPQKAGASRGYGPYNKKRQNGDKHTELFANPKRTCLSNRFLKSPDYQHKKKSPSGRFRTADIPHYTTDSSNKNLFADKTYEDHLHNLSEEQNEPINFSKQYSKKSIFSRLGEQSKSTEDVMYIPPNIAEYHAQRNAQMEVSRCENSNSDSPNHFLWRAPPNDIGEHSRSSENLVSRPVSYLSPRHPDFYLNSPPTISGGNVVHYVDSASDEDSRHVIKSGALKGGRQSPELSQSHKKVIGRKVKKKILDSDDSDDDDWPTNNRSRFHLIFSSSDSEVESSGRKVAQKPSAPPESTSNHPFPISKSVNSKKGFPCHMPAEYQPPYYNGDVFAGPSSSPVMYHSKSPSRSYRNRKHIRNSVPSAELPPSSFHSNRTGGGAVRGRNRVNVGERYTRRSGSPHPRTLPNSLPRMTRSDVSKSAKGRSLTGTHSRRANLNLATTYPDLFDAEDSSEVEFFTANSYSDTETSAESFGGLRISTTVRNPENNGVICEHSINVGSSEDEISVVFSTGPRNGESRVESQVVRNAEPRRGPRALGRRSKRGSWTQYRDNVHEVVSLSPDPVEQVRQVEDDERFARMLQAQFDAEVDPTYVPTVSSVTSPPITSPPVLFPYHNGTANIIVGDTDTEAGESDSAYNWNVTSYHLPYNPRGSRTNRVPMRPTTPMISSIVYNPRRLDRNRRRATSSAIDLRNPIARLFEASLIGLPFGDILSSDDSFETYLGLAELNGDVPRGLQKSEINRLPTRQYAVFSDEGPSTDLPHKRAGLNKECQVCLSDYENGDTLRILPCFHEFHTPCIDPWLKINHTCPVCRVVVDLES